MPTQGSLTNLGAAGLMTSGAPLSGYLQIGRDTLPAADWQMATAVPGAFRALPISRAIMGVQTTLQALDDVDTEAYADLASIGFWNMDPSSAGAELWWLGTAEAGEVLSSKSLNNDLIWTVALMLTPAQLANLSFNVSIETVPAASETVPGVVRLATEAEDKAPESNAVDTKVTSPLGRWNWWNTLAGGLVPPGAILPHAGTSAPDGWLTCDGSAVSRTAYADLFAAIGTTWGQGNGATTFNVPDLRRQTLVGAGAAGTSELGNAVGDTGGEESHSLTDGEMPAHNHGNAGGHGHPFRIWQSNLNPNNAAGHWYFSPHIITTENSPRLETSDVRVTSRDLETAGAHTHASVGAGEAHNILQPSAVVNFIIRI